MSVIQDISEYLKRRNARLDSRGAECIDVKKIMADVLSPYREDKKGVAKSIKKWEPQKHPRDEDGQFKAVGSSDEGKVTEKKEEKKEEKKPEESTGSSQKKGTVNKTSFKRNGLEMVIDREVPIRIFKSSKAADMLPGKVTKVIDFAGGSSKTPVKAEERLINDYGGKPGDWAHVAGDGKVRFPDGSERIVEIHWFENKSGEQYEWKVKYRNVRDRRK